MSKAKLLLSGLIFAAVGLFVVANSVPSEAIPNPDIPTQAELQKFGHCMGDLKETDLVAERTAEDGTVIQYFRNDEDIKRLVTDFRRVMKEKGYSDAEARKYPYYFAQSAKTLCGGTKDCSTKTCNTGSCTYSNVGMTGCKC